MLEYYAYYSMGGYKDLFIGSSECDDEYLYYSNLLQGWRNGERNFIGGEKTNRQLEEIDKLPQMVVIDSKCDTKLPSKLNNIETQGGYNMLCMKTDEKHWSITIREIPSLDVDEFGKCVRFLIHIVGDIECEIDCIAEYIRLNFNEVTEKMTHLFGYNARLNCYQFNLMEMNKITAGANEKTQSAPVHTDLPIHQIVVHSGALLREVARKIGVSVNDISVTYDEFGNIIRKVSQNESTGVYTDDKAESECHQNDTVQESNNSDEFLNKTLDWLRKMMGVRL